MDEYKEKQERAAQGEEKPLIITPETIEETVNPEVCLEDLSDEIRHTKEVKREEEREEGNSGQEVEEK